jgi:uncharacterized membrane protein
MEPILTVAALVVLFGATHVGLATRRIRAALVGRLGEAGFGILFGVVAAAAFGVLVHGYARLRFDGPPGLGLGALPVVREGLIVTAVLGVVLMAGSFGAYPSSPYGLHGRTHDGAPRGLERVTRHGFLGGMVLFAAAHALLATHLVGTAGFSGLALFAAVGAWHQDRKLFALRGAPYARYLAATSALPFAAIVAGRQRLVLGELPWAHLAAGLAAAAWLRHAHDRLFAAGGAWIVGVAVGGALLITLDDWWRARLRGRNRGDARPATAP